MKRIGSSSAMTPLLGSPSDQTENSPATVIGTPVPQTGKVLCRGGEGKAALLRSTVKRDKGTTPRAEGVGAAKTEETVARAEVKEAQGQVQYKEKLTCICTDIEKPRLPWNTRVTAKLSELGQKKGGEYIYDRLYIQGADTRELAEIGNSLNKNSHIKELSLGYVEPPLMNDFFDFVHLGFKELILKSDTDRPYFNRVTPLLTKLRSSGLTMLNLETYPFSTGDVKQLKELLKNAESPIKQLILYDCRYISGDDIKDIIDIFAERSNKNTKNTEKSEEFVFRYAQRRGDSVTRKKITDHFQQHIDAGTIDPKKMTLKLEM